MERKWDVGIAAGFGLLAVLILVNAGLSYHTTRQLHEHASQVAHTHEVLDALSELLSRVKDAETGQRGFLITGAHRYLLPYEQAVATVPNRIERVQQLTADNPRQQERIPPLRTLVQSKLQELAHTIELRQGPGFEAARQAVLTDTGRESMEALRSHLGEMQEEERSLLRERQQANDRAYRIAVATGTLGGVVAVVAAAAFFGMLRRHLTARARAAAVVHEQREVLHATLTSIGDGMIATDARGRVTLLNPVASALTGWSPEEACGAPLEKIFHVVGEESRQPIDNPIALALRQGRVVRLTNPTILLAKDGSECPIDDSAAPIRDRAGKISGAVLVFQEIRERRRQEQELRRQAAALAEAGRRKDQLRLMLAHELRNPLTAIRSTVQLWQRLPDTARTPASLEAVVGAVDRLNALVSRLLQFSRPEDQRQRVNFNSILTETLALLQAQAAAQGVTLERELAADLPDVLGSSGLLHQVALNLFTNALQVMPQGGRLHCQTRYYPETQEVECLVSDTGPGVPAADRDHLFELFFTTRPEGTGLGLALCREILASHGGRIALDEKAAPGATFLVTLPSARVNC